MNKWSKSAAFCTLAAAQRLRGETLRRLHAEMREIVGRVKGLVILDGERPVVIEYGDKWLGKSVEAPQ